MKFKTLQLRFIRLFVFILITISSGWLGWLLDKKMEQQSEEETLGMALWLVLPVLSVLLIKLFARDSLRNIGLKPRLYKNLKWYVVAFLIFPMVTFLVLLCGYFLGWVDVSRFNIKIYLTGFISLLLPAFIKNIFEEVVWRGYLTTQLIELKIKDFWLYLIVGGVWGLWHLPYYLYLLPQSDIEQVLRVERLTFAIIAIFTMIGWTVMFVELYRISKCIWTVVLLHAMEDAVVNHLVIENHIIIDAEKSIIISPIIGILPTLIYISMGFWLRKKRIAKDY